MNEFAAIKNISQNVDSKMDIDVGKAPEPHRLSPSTDPSSIPTLDGWIENLINCKQLAENDVSRLCDRVDLHLQQSYETSVLTDPFAQAREVLQDESNVQPVVQ